MQGQKTEKNQRYIELIKLAFNPTIGQVKHYMCNKSGSKKGKRKVQGVPHSQTAALPRPQVEEVTDKSKQAQTEQTHENH